MIITHCCLREVLRTSTIQKDDFGDHFRGVLPSNFWTVSAHRQVYGWHLSVAEPGLTEKIRMFKATDMIPSVYFLVCGRGAKSMKER